MKLIITEKQLKIIKESINTITLSQIYDGSYPHEDEMIWNFVGKNEFDIPLPIKYYNPIDIFNTWSIDGETTIKEVYENYATREQKNIIKSYFNNIESAKSDYIVTDNKLLIDGFHRIVALALKNINTIKGVDLSHI